jgi:hypothetical protein
MMFSSPAVGSNGAILNESTSSGVAFNPIAEIEDDPNGSFAAENDGIKNPDARSNATPGFDKMALRTLKEGTEGPVLRCSTSRHIGRIGQLDPFRDLAEHYFPSGPGFTIYSENEEKIGDIPSAAFQIYEDSSSKPAASLTTSLQLWRDEMILKDRAVGKTIDECSVGDTATISLSEDIFKSLGSRGNPALPCTDSEIGDRKLDFDVSQRKQPPCEIVQDSAATKSFSQADGDTATFSVFNEIEAALLDNVESSSDRCSSETVSPTSYRKNDTFHDL